MSHQSPASTTNNNQLVTRKRRRGMIEKKRRDKINNSLGELRRLVPAAFEKQGSSKLEKAEILQMTVDYLRLLHANGLADILISKSKHLEQMTPVHSRPATIAPATATVAAAAATATAAAAANASATTTAATATATHPPVTPHHQNHSMAYTSQHHALTNHRVSPPSSDQFANQDNGQLQSLDPAASYQHPRALYQYQAAAAASTIYPGYQDHLPSYYYG